MAKSETIGLTLVDLLRTFVALEGDADAIPVLGDDDAMRVLSAWQKTDQIWKIPKSKMPKVSSRNHAEVWAWIRAGWEIDHDAIERGTGLSQWVIRSKLAMLIGARLMYPDGNISKAARAALQLFVARKLGIKPKRPDPDKKPPDPKKSDKPTGDGTN